MDRRRGFGFNLSVCVCIEKVGEFVCVYFLCGEDFVVGFV